MDSCQALTEKEKQTLRLMGRGHDAKSMAHHLGLSVHTVNERLRAARRKMSVSSSREAARRLLDTEGPTPENLGDKQMGEAARRASVEGFAASDAIARTKSRFVWGVVGVVVMSLIIGIAALSSLSAGSAPSTGAVEAQPLAATTAGQSETEAVRAARAWLALGDQGRWNDGWRATSKSFRDLNTAKVWADVSERVRKPLGAMLSRTALSQETVPAPPAGVEVVKFRTSFANKPEAIETVSLVREDADWKVVGIFLE